MSDVPLDETPSYVEPFGRLQLQTVTWLWLYRLASCRDEAQQVQLLTRLRAEGLECRALLS